MRSLRYGVATSASPVTVFLVVPAYEASLEDDANRVVRPMVSSPSHSFPRADSRQPIVRGRSKSLGVL